MINHFKVLALGLSITIGLISGNEVLANTSKDNSTYTITEDGASHSIVFFNSTDDPTDGGALNPDSSHAKDDEPAADTHGDEAHADLDAHAHAEPAAWSVIPFVLLLLMIATGPLFYAHFWHNH